MNSVRPRRPLGIRPKVLFRGGGDLRPYRARDHPAHDRIVMYYDGHDTGWGPGRWIVMGLMMLAFWGLLAALVVYLVRNLGHRPGDDRSAAVKRPDDAMRILDERFARGDIDADDYNQRREVLNSR